ncbi:UNVERIFIED_CONTAM: hypothetical protein GTU68_024721, partial [Idotea baltica]|nr:hypothetical protein [Idotea baltica]
MVISKKNEESLLRFVTLGSVDDGKSTLLGRLLYDSDSIPVDIKVKLENSILNKEDGVPDFSLLTDGLLAEREQKITIDVAHVYFRTKKRVYIVYDSPGHEQYTRNMATAASNADVALLIVDARKGISRQTRRHAFIASLLGIKKISLIINKMDAVNYCEATFLEIVKSFRAITEKLEFMDVKEFPISALYGDNVVHDSKNMPWYSGGTLLHHLDNEYIGSSYNKLDFRYPVQYVVRPNQDYRGFAGKISSGRVKVGDSVVVLPS